jgi:endonuclease/exonuclease/phosphatase family metal-dependent hydrolase
MEPAASPSALRRGKPGLDTKERRGSPGRKPAFLAAVLLLLPFLGETAGGVPRAQQVRDFESECRTVDPSVLPGGIALEERAPVSVQWEGPNTPTDRAELDLWCRAVGPPESYRPSRSPPGLTVAGELAFVAWNTNVGRADLGALIQDLKAGHLTGVPETHFILLLQEAFRAGDPVPAMVSDGARSAERIGGEVPDRHLRDIRSFAHAEGLHLFYAPSMRNGHPGHPDQARGGPEDRGNAIVSTLPLSDLQIVELPVQKQRRVVVAATVRGNRPDGRPWQLRVASVHLDHVSSWGRFHRSFGAGRADHARILVETFAQEPRMVLGGDLNTWFRGSEEEAVRILRVHFPGPSDPPDAPTLNAPLFPLNRLVDHLFFRLGDDWVGDYTVAGHRYGSDHRPLVGRIRPPDPPGAASGAAPYRPRGGG